MIEQDGFMTTYDSHKQTSSEPTELDKFKEEAGQVYELAKSICARVKTDEFKQCFGDWMDEEDFKSIYHDAFQIYKWVQILNYNVGWYEGGKKN